MKPYPVEFRAKIIEVWQRDQLSMRQLAKQFKVSKSFIQKLIKQYKETGDLRPLPQGGSCPSKINNEQMVDLVVIIDENNDATLEELCELLNEKRKVKVSKSTMGRITQKLNYTLKKKTLSATEKKTDRVQKKRGEYWKQVRDIKAENLIFIDEFGVNLAMTRLYARALKGTRARGDKPQKRGKNVSVIGALSLEKVLSYCPIYGSVDGLTFEAFVVTKLAPLLWKDACVVMDNAKSHFGEMVRETIENTGAKLIYLSPYSPEFSPIENCWCGRHCRIPAGFKIQQGRQSKVKSILRKLKPRNYQDLIDHLASALLQVTQNDIRNWFAHCCYCTS